MQHINQQPLSRTHTHPRNESFSGQQVQLLTQLDINQCVVQKNSIGFSSELGQNQSHKSQPLNSGGPEKQGVCIQNPDTHQLGFWIGFKTGKNLSSLGMQLKFHKNDHSNKSLVQDGRNYMDTDNLTWPLQFKMVGINFPSFGTKIWQEQLMTFLCHHIYIWILPMIWLENTP